MTKGLEELRKEIDSVDTRLIDLLNERAGIALEIGRAKKDGRIYDPARERLVIEKVLDKSSGDFPDDSLKTVYGQIISTCRNLQRRLRVGYLGPEGTYTEQAAKMYLGETSEFVSASTISDVFALVNQGRVDVVVVPIENSTEGSVNRTYDELIDTDLKVIGEVILPIHHQLVSSAKKLSNVKKVVAHAQALAQCREWLSYNLPNVECVAVSSNAEGVKMASKDDSLAAIGGESAAEVYGVPIVGVNIEDESNNTTRFVVLAKDEVAKSGNDKTSLICSVPNTAGSLNKLLNVLAGKGINMTKLESRPAKSALWDYVFFIDLDGHSSDKRVAVAFKKASQVVTFVKNLGSYPKGEAL